MIDYHLRDRCGVVWRSSEDVDMLLAARSVFVGEENTDD